MPEGLFENQKNVLLKKYHREGNPYIEVNLKIAPGLTDVAVKRD